MKFLLTLTLLGLAFSTNAAELDSISLIMPKSYARSSTFTQTVKSKIQANAADTFNIDIEKRVVEKIIPYKKDLENYFPRAGELDSFLKDVIQTGIKKHLSDVTDDNLIAFYGYLGNNLIGKLADKILEKEGVVDPTRRALWVDKLTQPFNACISVSMNAQYDANHCIDALTSSLVPSTGIGIVYELSRSNLNKSLPADKQVPFDNEQAGLYKSCIAKTKASATDVKNCALTTMKVGVLKITNLSLSKSIDEKASSKNAATSIKKQVWPAFNSCTNNVGNNPTIKNPLSEQFMNCIDDLVSNTGSLIVLDKVSTTPVIKKLFSAPEVKKLSLEKSAQFEKCASGQKIKGAKKDGMLDTSPCENAITNEITYKVVAQTFRETAKSSLNENPALAIKTGKQGVEILDKCWDNKQSSNDREVCLKKSIITYSQNVATIKLDTAIPDAMPGKKDLNKLSVADLSQCLDKELPTNISESNDLNKRLGVCTGKLTKNVALKVADYQIRDTAKGNLSKEEIDKLVTALVQVEFAKCIGNSPDDETLLNCSNTLTSKAAKKITEISFDKEVNSYLKNAGGLDSLGINQSIIDSFLVDLNKSNNACIDTKTKGAAIDQVNLCVKGSIKKIALFFGDLKFNQSVGEMYKDRDGDKKKVTDQFKKTLSECLDTKSKKEFSITDYTKNLYTCSDKVASSTTMAIGQDQVNTALEQYLKDRPNMNLSAKRDAIRKELLGNFQACMSHGSNQNSCIDNLKKGATSKIVIEYGRAETKAQMNADKTPSKLRPVEDNFIACTDTKLQGDELSKHLDECTKNFALNFAKELGNLKLTTLLKQALGTKDYNAQKANIDESITKYESCLDKLKVFKMSEGLADKLTVCTDGLTARGLTIVRSNINNWMSSEDKDAATLMIKREFAVFLPCLSALLPASPYTQQLQQNVDSSVKPLAILLGHYIDYNPESAKQTLESIMTKLNIDLDDVAKTQKAKSNLLDYLYKSGGLDQFLKGIIRGTVQDALAITSDKDVDPELKAILLQKQNYEDIFNSEEGSKIKDIVMDKILKPVLLEGVDTKDAAYQINIDTVKDRVIKLLINAPSFGETAIKMTIQKQINAMGGITKFFAKTLYGGDALNWEKVRQTDEGKKAEAYIKVNVLTPKFKGITQSSTEQKKTMDTAQQMVTNAVKAYGK